MKSFTLILVLAAVTFASATLQSRSDITNSRLQSRSSGGVCASGQFLCQDNDGKCCPNGTQCIAKKRCSDGNDRFDTLDDNNNNDSNSPNGSGNNGELGTSGSSSIVKTQTTQLQLFTTFLTTTTTISIICLFMYN
ncbi:7139_t:CDS:1 [Paraglomus brasilianum]|uniref:7139_t:CDS:1 n=1 Tax=Paraglomus brasilianum TaxID=144538 RepID=A0A9N9C395_9GLOM|nr:7139_t:CDS:1 [Paraglomus brasilianum]